MARKLVPPEVERLNQGMVHVVPVIASFDSAGTIKPLYVRIRGYSYKILSCWSKQCYSNIFVYYCTVENNHVHQEIALTYHSGEMCWTIKL